MFLAELQRLLVEGGFTASYKFMALGVRVKDLERPLAPGGVARVRLGRSAL